MSHVEVIGSGFSVLSAACFLAEESFKVVKELCQLFERLEAGSAKPFIPFLQVGKQYTIGVQDLVYQPGLSVTELFKPVVLNKSLNLHLVESLSSYCLN